MKLEMKKNMKPNYHNEDYKSCIFNIIVYILLIIFIIGWWFINGMIIEAGVIVFCSVLIFPVLILMFFSIKTYKKRQRQRNLNLFIMKNGICIKGRISRIYDQYIDGMDINKRNIHNVTVEVEYQEENNKKTVAVDDLEISINNMKQYNNKEVNIYIYNNMSYIDIINN